MKRVHNYILFLLFGVLYLSMTPAQTIYAADQTYINSTVRVSPILIKIQLEPGSKRIYPISVDNLTDSPMPIHANVEGFDPTDEENGFTPSPPAEISPLAKWITITDPDAIIPARQSHEFLIKVTIPSTVPLGGYYAMVYFTPLYQNGSIGSKIGVITLANIGVQDSLQQKASILEFQFEKLIYEHGPITSTLRIKNDSLHFFSTKPTLQIAPLWGSSDSVELDEKTILPGKSRYWKSVYTIQNSKWGIYKVIISANIENGESIRKTIPLIILPYRILLLIVTVLLLIVWIMKKRRNIKTAFMLLLSKDNELTQMDKIESVDVQTRESVSSHVHSLNVSVADASRIAPQQIIETLREQQGSIRKTADILGIHRSTIHRWKQRAMSVPLEKGAMLARKSTRPHTVRTTSLPSPVVQQIHLLHTKQHMTARQIQLHLNLTVSVRTILRILKKQESQNI